MIKFASRWYSIFSPGQRQCSKTACLDAFLLITCTYCIGMYASIRIQNKLYVLLYRLFGHCDIPAIVCDVTNERSWYIRYLRDTNALFTMIAGMNPIIHWNLRLALCEKLNFNKCNGKTYKIGIFSSAIGKRFS